MARTQITITTEVDLDISTAAKWFWGLDDEQQADFFVEVAKVADSDKIGHGLQWDYVSNHLASCKCSTPEARDMVRMLAGRLGEHDDDMKPIGGPDKGERHE